MVNTFFCFFFFFFFGFLFCFFFFLPFDARPLGYVASMTPRRRQISDGGSGSSGEGEG